MRIFLMALALAATGTAADAATTLVAKGELYGTITSGSGLYEYWDSNKQEDVVIGGDLTGQSFTLSFVVNSTDSESYCYRGAPCLRGTFEYDLPDYEHANLFNTSYWGWRTEKIGNPDYIGRGSNAYLRMYGVSVEYPDNDVYAWFDLRFSGASPADGPLSGSGKLHYEYSYDENADMDIRFKLTHGWVVYAGSNVPEPAAWALMIAGFGMVGGAARRRRAIMA